MSNNQQVYVFNQYYIDFLKKIKTYAKEYKESKKDARDILRSIRNNFTSMDKMSETYFEYINNSNILQKFREQENKLELNEEIKDEMLYKNIKISQILSVIKNPYILTHFLCLLDIFTTNDIDTEKIVSIIKMLNNKDEYNKLLEDVEDEILKSKLELLQEMFLRETAATMDDSFKELENSSLGKLAKELMGDINVEKLQESLNDPNMNILSAIQDPSSEFGKVLGNVSQKMMGKIASGELNQQNMLKDAIDLSTKIPNLLPPELGSQLSGLSSMFNSFQNMGKGAGDGDSMGGMMDMMKNMMTPDMMSNLGLGNLNLNKSQKKKAAKHMSNHMTKQQKIDKLKRKLKKYKEESKKEEYNE